jgi:hypothetical protein
VGGSWSTLTSAKPDNSSPLIHNAEPEDLHETSRSFIRTDISFRNAGARRFEAYRG